MALDPRRRARQLAKKAAAAKRRGRQRSGESQHGSIYRLDLIRQAARYPLYECHMGDGLPESGFGTVIVSRRSGTIVASGVFLLDTWCLGVKNCFTRIQPERDYMKMMESLREREDLMEIDAACARKQVEGAVAYARDLGFEPNADYGVASQLFGDIDTGGCEQEFVFGKDGKPFFVSGPTDTPARIEKIMRTLERRCGPGGSDFMVHMPSDDLDGDGI
jgi:hypothetical protein